MKKYVCKYCGKTIAIDRGLNPLNNTVRFIDHLLIRHHDQISEYGSYYINDIPGKCYITEELNGRGKAEDKEEQSIMHFDIT